MTDPTQDHPLLLAGDIAHPATPAPRGTRWVLPLIALAAVAGMAVYALRVPLGMAVRRELDHVTASAHATQATPGDAAQLADLTAQLAQTQARVTALEQRVATLAAKPPAPATPATTLPALPPASLTGGDAMVVALSTRMDALAARQDKLDTAQATDAARLEAAANQAEAIGAVTDRAARLARVQSATAALAAGLPLGDLPNAPPALARFRTDPPPTEAALRLAFPAAARAARAAARPSTATLGFWPALRARVDSLITIRRGDTTILGSPQIGLIDQARTALDAGDLAGAVATLTKLDGPPAAAMTDWQTQAQSLLAARAALAQLAARS
jgi:hypothetical protein